jgi:hypothetical protein
MRGRWELTDEQWEVVSRRTRAGFIPDIWQGADVISTYPSIKKTILCVDDDAAILCYEKALLEKSGYAVITAASGLQALRLVAMCKCDIVLHGKTVNISLPTKRPRPPQGQSIGTMTLSTCPIPTGGGPNPQFET